MTVPAVSPAALQQDAQRLTAVIAGLTRRWEATSEVDTELGAEVQDTGERLMFLAEQLAAAAVPQQAVTLREIAGRLRDATGYYGSLDEHDTGASIDVFGQLGPGIAVVSRFAAAAGCPYEMGGSEPCGATRAAGEGT